MNSIGAVKVLQGDKAYKFPFMNRNLYGFIIWEKDEEFPPAANILFDETSSSILTLRIFAVVPDVAIDIIKNKGIMPRLDRFI